MRRLLIAISLALALICTPTQKLAAQQTLVVMPQWSPQTQFAGFYVALEKGYYKEAGLDIVLRHPNLSSTASTYKLLEKDDVQILGDMLINGIINRSNGVKLVNIMQLTQHNGMLAVCNKPVDTPRDLDGMRIGRWSNGFDNICTLLMHRDSVKVDWVSSIGHANNLFIFGAVDAVLCYSYSEFIKLRMSAGEIPADHVLRFADEGFDYPEDGLYVTEKFYNKNKDVLDRFIEATKKGWEYASENREEAIGITFRHVMADHIAITNHMTQKLMLDEYLRLLEKEEGAGLSFESVGKEEFDALVDKLADAGIISRKVTYEEVIR
jgi:NitT/TauT family transport system substrate-binding protein